MKPYCWIKRLYFNIKFIFHCFRKQNLARVLTFVDLQYGFLMHKFHFKGIILVIQQQTYKKGCNKEFPAVCEYVYIKY